MYQFIAIFKMKIIPENAETHEEGKLQATMTANRIINELNAYTDHDIDLNEVKDVTPRFSLRSTAEARELIDNHICHEE
jgi:tRNA U38,U39,U40 pseudouridine synthase TruA